MNAILINDQERTNMNMISPHNTTGGVILNTDNSSLLQGVTKMAADSPTLVFMRSLRTYLYILTANILFNLGR